jgi:hypothetical protein
MVDLMITPIVGQRQKPSTVNNLEHIIQVLHVDDDADFLKTSKQILQADSSFSVENATSVQDALELLKNKTFDAIISDYQLPEKNGLDFLKELRSTEEKNPVHPIYWQRQRRRRHRGIKPWRRLLPEQIWRHKNCIWATSTLHQTSCGKKQNNNTAKEV